jgi:hypothetical protein
MAELLSRERHAVCRSSGPVGSDRFVMASPSRTGDHVATGLPAAADLTQITDGAGTGACVGQTHRPLLTTSWARAAVYSFLTRAATGRPQVSQIRTPAVGIGAPSVRLVTVTGSLLVIARPGDISPLPACLDHPDSCRLVSEVTHSVAATAMQAASTPGPHRRPGMSIASNRRESATEQVTDPALERQHRQDA